MISGIPPKKNHNATTADQNDHLHRIHKITPRPDIQIGYHFISEFLHQILKIKFDPDFSTKRNRIFFKEEFAHPFLNDGEMAGLNAFKSMKKQMEWMAGRYLIKKMVRDFFDDTMNLEDITIGHQEKGAPFIKNRPDTAISISHSGDIAAAALGKVRGTILGLDLEKIQKIPTREFMNLAFTAKERAAMKNEPGEIFKAWTLKEAYLKYIKKGFHESLHRVEVVNNQVYHNKIKKKLSLFSKKIEGSYMISLICK